MLPGTMSKKVISICISLVIFGLMGLHIPYIEMEAGSLEEAEALATGSNYAAAREYVEASTTAATYEEIEEIEKQLDEGLTIDEIEAAAEEAEEAEEIAAAIAAAKEYVEARREFTGDLWYVKNDAANIYADNYDDYMLIWEAIKNL